ncbi:MAG TPA: thiamine pyrophosphate-dependent enzyme [Candidatus Dormibacteraeota bacterium]|nr:thiamine pyrophosphate-dependent enzyme [Candidatus Dormibacteraeota bacterium]
MRAPGDGHHPDTLLARYRTMVMARAIERRLWVLDRLLPPHTVRRSRTGREATLAGVGQPTLAWTGFEAVQAAAAAVLRPGVDWIVPCNRDLTLCLAAGMSPLAVMLAIFARGSDPGSGGRQVPGAFGSRSARIVMTSMLAGRHAVQAAGIAYASKVSGRDEVTLVCTDERGTLAGDWHEGINFAGAHSLPLICLVEDFAVGSSPIGDHGDESPASRAQGYGLAAETIDGGDFDAALAAFGRAAARARSSAGPTLIHAAVPNLASSLPGGGRRPPEELEALAAHDPIDRMRRRLAAAGILDSEADDRIQRDCAAEVEAAVEQARASAPPEGALALQNVFSEEQVHG